MRVLGLVNARGGSKGIPGKNIKTLLGKPLIAYSIEAGLASRSVTDVVVSTEDEEIARVARECGAQVPFVRPAHLSADNVRQMGAVLHALEFLERVKGAAYDIIVLLQPTSPMRSAADIDAAIDTMLSAGADSVVSLSPVTEHPYQMYRIDEGRPVKFVEKPRMQRQQFSEVYIANGAVYAARRSVVVEKESFFGGNCVAYVMNDECSVTIDEPSDWTRAEFFMSRECTDSRRSREGRSNG